MDAADSSIAVMLVDDSDIYRGALRAAIDNEDGLHVVAEARCVSEAIVRSVDASMDVAIVDRRLPDGDGIDLCHRLVGDGIPCIVLTASVIDDEIVDLARRAGARILMQKGSSMETLANAIREAAASSAG